MSEIDGSDGDAEEGSRARERVGYGSDAGASASSGRSGSWRVAKATEHRQMNATLRGAASSGEQRGATTGPRKGVRVAGDASRGTSKRGIRRGSSKSSNARRAGVP